MANISGDISDVMKACGCGEERAANLLQRSDNDVRKAIEKHQATINLINSHRPKLSPPYNQGVGSNGKGPHKSQDSESSENDDSGDDETLNTLGTDESQKSKSPATHARFSTRDYTVQPGRYRKLDTPILPHQPPKYQVTPEHHGHRISTVVGEGSIAEGDSKSGDESKLPAVQNLDIVSDNRSDAGELQSESGGSNDGEEEPEWDFLLPALNPPPLLQPGVGEGQEGFNLEELLGAVQYGATAQDINQYLGYYDQRTVHRHINGSVLRFPAMFYVVASNNDWVLRTWVQYGGDVNAVHQASGVPLLAFAIMNAETLQTDTTQIVAAILSLGASPFIIPTAFYSPFCRDLPDNGPELEGLEAEQQWCTEAAKEKLSKTMNLTQRYYLERSSKTKKPSIRHRQIALRRNAESLLGIPYFLIGQTTAANLLLRKLLSHLMIPSKKPLVLVFAGPSGHGKTELARRLGYLLSLALEVVDCTIFNREMELFGPRNPYVGAAQGSPLNNFLAQHEGERCIVFLDEFEKTTTDIHQALLLPFDNGEYQDRRNLKKIDCSKTIWILATNALDSTIQNFCALHHTTLFVEEEEAPKMKLMKSLAKEIKEDFLSKFDSPITGRVSAFIPFLPFSPGEQAVVVHKYLLELGQQVRARINLSTGQKEQLLGNVRLRIRRDASVCRILAEAEYHMDLGARSLITAVKSVEDLLVEAYLEVDEEIIEDEGVVDFLVDVNGGELIANMVHPVGNKAESPVPS